jgi:hypothetical protein
MTLKFKNTYNEKREKIKLSILEELCSDNFSHEQASKNLIEITKLASP